jgi:transcriptional regulator with XRE-family HTH domain
MAEIWATHTDLPTGRSRAVPGFDSAKLRYLRRSRAMLTQKELADLAGISRGAVSHLEQGRRQPMVTTLRALCSALDCDPGDLISDEGIEHDLSQQDAPTGHRSRAAV